MRRIKDRIGFSEETARQQGKPLALAAAAPAYSPSGADEKHEDDGFEKF